MNIHESAEDYLEAILILGKQLGTVRSIDIVNKMNYSKPSISIAMKKLRENGYIDMDGNGYITLKDSGREIAEKIYSRHRLLQEILEKIGVDPAKAEEEACKIEHDIDEETYQKILECFERHTELYARKEN